MSRLITAPEEATPELLTQMLRRGGYLPQGHVTAVDYKLGHRSELSVCAHLEVTYSFDTGSIDAVSFDTGERPPRNIFLKIAGLETPQDKREVAFYQDVAPTLESPAFLDCYAAHYDAERGVYHLLLPDISATHMLKPAWNESQWFRSAYRTEIVLQLAEALAAVHARYWGLAANKIEAGPLEGLDLTFVPEDIQSTYEKRAANLEPCLAALGTWLTKGQQHLFRRLARRGPEILAARFRHGPLTLVHGDPHTQNLVVPRWDGPQEAAAAQALVIDWGTLQQSFGPEDVASYMAPFWYPRLRRQAEDAVLRRYHEGLERGGVRGYTWEQCWDDYRLGVVGRLLYRLRVPPLGDHAGLWIFENTLAAFEELDCGELLD
jgi:hypothetical protein